MLFAHEREAAIMEYLLANGGFAGYEEITSHLYFKDEYEREEDDNIFGIKDLSKRGFIRTGGEGGVILTEEGISYHNFWKEW